MAKHLKPAARDNDTTDAAYAKLAGAIAKVASLHHLILVSPLLPRDGHWWRMFAFASDATVMTTMTVTLGPEIPTLVEQGLLISSLRRRFEDVQAFDSVKAMALAARAAWPCLRADEFLASADIGPGFRDFQNS